MATSAETPYTHPLVPLLAGLVGVVLGGSFGLLGTRMSVDAAAEQARDDRRIVVYAEYTTLMTERYADVTLDSLEILEAADVEPESIDRQALIADVTLLTDAYFRLLLVASSEVSDAASDVQNAYHDAASVALNPESTLEQLSDAVGALGQSLVVYLEAARTDVG